MKIDKHDRASAPAKYTAIRTTDAPMRRAVRMHHQIGVKKTKYQNAAAGTVGTDSGVAPNDQTVVPPKYGIKVRNTKPISIGARSESGAPHIDNHSKRFRGDRRLAGRGSDMKVSLGPASSRPFTDKTNFLRCLSMGGVSASSQCGVLIKYSSALLGSTSSIRSGMMGIPLLTARSTSRFICGDALECPEKTSTITFEPEIASMMHSLHSLPGGISRGAIQQRIPAASRVAQAASAVVLS